jgi:hypothetical protein
VNIQKIKHQVYKDFRFPYILFTSIKNLKVLLGFGINLFKIKNLQLE